MHNKRFQRKTILFFLILNDCSKKSQDSFHIWIYDYTEMLEFFFQRLKPIKQ